MKAIYYYKGQEVVLAYENEVVGIEPITVEGNMGVYPAEGFPSGEVDHCATLDDCYSCYTDAEEIIFGEIINPENEKGVVLGWLRKSEYLRQRALIEIKNKPDSWFEKLMIDEHYPQIFRVCVYPDGDVAKLEYVSSTDYTTGIECVHEVGGSICNCDTCTQYQDLDELTKEEFIEKWGEDIYDYVNTYSYEYAIVDECHNAGVYADDLRQEIMNTINEIEADFFED